MLGGPHVFRVKTKVENVNVEDPKLENEIVEDENKVEILGRQNLIVENENKVEILGRQDLGFANLERPAAAAIWFQNG